MSYATPPRGPDLLDALTVLLGAVLAMLIYYVLSHGGPPGA